MKHKHDLSKKQQKHILIIAIIVFVLVLAFSTIAIALPMLKLSKEQDAFRTFVTEKGIWGPFIYCGLVILQIVVALIPGEPFEIVAGYAFGSLKGTMFCMLAEALGSVLVILLVRFFGVKLLEVFFSKEKIESLNFLKSSPKRTGLFMIFFILPGTPKDLLCYFGGLTDIKLSVLLLICTLGRIPSIVTSIIGGNALETKDYGFAILVFGITIVISLIGLLIYNASVKKNSP